MFGRFVLKAVSFLKKEDGPTAVEYAVMLALIIIAIFAAVTAIAKKSHNDSETPPTQYLRRTGVDLSEHLYEYVEQGGTAAGRARDPRETP